MQSSHACKYCYSILYHICEITERKNRRTRVHCYITTFSYTFIQYLYRYNYRVLWRNTCDSHTCPLCTACGTGSDTSSACTRDKCTVPVRPGTRSPASTRSGLSPGGWSPWSPAKSWCSTVGRVQISGICRRPRSGTGTKRAPLPEISLYSAIWPWRGDDHTILYTYVVYLYGRCHQWRIREGGG